MSAGARRVTGTRGWHTMPNGHFRNFPRSQMMSPHSLSHPAKDAFPDLDISQYVV